jgi:hypothetical protein
VQVFPARSIQVVFGEPILLVAGYDIRGIGLNETRIKASQSIDERCKCLFEIIVIFVSDGLDWHVGLIQ